MKTTGSAVVMALLSLAGPGGTAVAELEESERRRLRALIGSKLSASLEHCEESGIDPPLAPLRASACGGCNVALPTSKLFPLKQRLGAIPCPRCSRIVYDPAFLEAEAAVETPRPRRRGTSVSARR